MRNLGLVLIFVVGACSSSSGGSTKDAPPAGAALTVKNFDSWCSITVGSGSASSAAMQVVTVPPGMVTLTAVRAGAAFEIDGNVWHHTDGDTGTGEPGTITNPTDPATKTTTAKVTVAAAAKCVYACCPFADGTGCEPASVPEQCP